MTSADLKLKAKEQLNGKKKDAALALFIVVLITGIASSIANRLFPGQVVPVEGLDGVTITSTSTLATLITSFVSTFLGLGLTSYFMKIARGEEVSLGELFSKGNILLKAFVSSLVAGIIIGLGFIALIIPGIILALGYALIDYLYIDNPEIGILDVLKKSREMMKGHKWQYFCLCFSFIGWAIIGVFTLGLLYFWLMPYMGVAQANFYDAIKED